MEGRRAGQTRARVQVVEDGRSRSQRDLLAIEEPLEIRLRVNRETHPVAVTMRTPGHDYELTAGFLFAEGLIAGRDDLDELSFCTDDGCGRDQQYNSVTATLRPHAEFDPALLTRRFAMTSACGICGKASLDDIERRGIDRLPAGMAVAVDVLYALPDKLRAGQRLFATTGGLHAAGLFTTEGELIAVREDVGRHNAVDKLIGWALLDGRLPLHNHVVLVSGRSSFEIAQKCVTAGVQTLCAVSAPSSLAVDLARRFDLALIGFLRGNRFTVYHGAHRISLRPESPPLFSKQSASVTPAAG